ncbi:MAG TPA: B12-binding domain-containing protein [Solirubrobacterales bacterium]|nr:B12-binding domain-containing protein [Solirubrobacterales bacterium]
MTERSVWTENSANLDLERAASRFARLYLDSLRAADTSGAFRVASGALEQGMTVPQLYQRVISPAMHEVGELWERGALTVADEHLATALTHRVLAALRPQPGAGPTGASMEKGCVMLAAVQGEQHALGLRMAADVLEDAGFRTIYLGADVPTDALLQAISSLSPDSLVLGVTMPELTPQLHEVADAVRKAHPQLGLLVGGQAASPPEGGMLIQDLEALPERLPQA